MTEKRISNVSLACPCVVALPSVGFHSRDLTLHQNNVQELKIHKTCSQLLFLQHDPEDLTPRLCCGALRVCGMEGTTFLLCLPSFIMQDFGGQSLINQGTYLSKRLVLSELIGIFTGLIVRTNKKMTASEMAPITLQNINLRLSWN